MAEENTNLPPLLIAQETPAAPATMTPSTRRVDRTDKLVFAITSVIALLIYLCTMAPEVTLGDSGILATSGVYAGVPSPPGYPAWVIYSWLFTKLIPFLNLAWRIAFGSAFATAIACGLIALTISFTGNLLLAATPKYTRLEVKDVQALRIVCGCVAGLCLAFCSTVWREAVIVSTWSFGLLLFTAILWCLTRCCFAIGQRRWFFTAFFLFGVLLTNNQEMLVALPGFICLLLVCKPQLGRDVGLCVLPWAALLMYGSSMRVFQSFDFFQDFDYIIANWALTGAFVAGFLAAIIALFVTHAPGSHLKTALIGCVCLTCGWMFYLYPAIASMSTPPVNWGYPRNFEGFGWQLVRGQYDFCGAPSPEGYARDVLRMVRIGGNDFGWLCFVIALIPLGLLWKPSQNVPWLLGLVAIGLCTSLALVAMLDRYDSPQSWDALRMHFGPALAIVAVFMGIGLMQIGTMIGRPAPRLSA